MEQRHGRNCFKFNNLGIKKIQQCCLDKDVNRTSNFFQVRDQLKLRLTANNIYVEIFEGTKVTILKFYHSHSNWEWGIQLGKCFYIFMTQDE